MKQDINLLPPNPKVQFAKVRQKRAITLASGLLIIFLVINLIIFGSYFLITKDTSDTIEAIKNEEAKITSMASREKLYRSLGAKLSFLAGIWQKTIRPDEVTIFSENLLVDEVNLSKITLGGDGMTTLYLTANNSYALEQFLNGVEQEETNGKIKKIRLTSASKNADGGYDLRLSFLFLGAK